MTSTDRTSCLTDASDASAVLPGLIAIDRARTCAQLIAATGLSRSTLAKRLQLLLDANLIADRFGQALLIPHAAGPATARGDVSFCTATPA